MLPVLNMPVFRTDQGSKYVRATQGSECVWICLIMLEYVWICLNMREYASIYLNLPERLLFYFSHSNSLSKGTTGCFIKEKKFDIFYSSWKYLICLGFFFKLNIFASKISSFQLPLCAKCRAPWMFIFPINISMMFF